jgi:hypothetical protein
MIRESKNNLSIKVVWTCFEILCLRLSLQTPGIGYALLRRQLLTTAELLWVVFLSKLKMLFHIGLRRGICWILRLYKHRFTSFFFFFWQPLTWNLSWCKIQLKVFPRDIQSYLFDNVASALGKVSPLYSLGKRRLHGSQSQPEHFGIDKKNLASARN